jgi:hypothetical protein
MNIDELKLLFNYNNKKNIKSFFIKYNSDYVCSKLKIKNEQLKNIKKGKLSKNFNTKIYYFIIREMYEKYSKYNIGETNNKIISGMYIYALSKNKSTKFLLKIPGVFAKRLIFLQSI